MDHFVQDGYNMGWRKFRVQSALKGIFLSEEDAYRAVSNYRANHRSLEATWKWLTKQLPGMYRKEWSVDKGPITLVHEGIELPNGMRLDYSGLDVSENGDWYYGLGTKYKKIYGGAMLENIIQALARVILGDYLLSIEAAGITTVSSTHDEPIMIVPETEGDAAAKIVTDIMTVPPVWAPELPLAVDIGWAKEYSK